MVFTSSSQSVATALSNSPELQPLQASMYVPEDFVMHGDNYQSTSTHHNREVAVQVGTLVQTSTCVARCGGVYTSPRVGMHTLWDRCSIATLLQTVRTWWDPCAVVLYHVGDTATAAPTTPTRCKLFAIPGTYGVGAQKLWIESNEELSGEREEAWTPQREQNTEELVAQFALHHVKDCPTYLNTFQSVSQHTQIQFLLCLQYLECISLCLERRSILCRIREISPMGRAEQVSGEAVVAQPPQDGVVYEGSNGLDTPPMENISRSGSGRSNKHTDSTWNSMESRKRRRRRS
uniref:Dihydrodipicolinate reductase n=1 Tax=Lygus hesperus TaxID=30085 RepID=A0A0A9XIK6_LYGHE